MPIPTKTGIEGFIASDPTLSYTRYGDARFYARVGIPQSTRDEDGNFHQTDPYFTDMVMFGKSAERAYNQFQKSDNFLAEGQERTYMQTVDGQQQQREQFRAGSIGHNNNMTTYEVDRSRATERTAERTAERDQARSTPEREAADQQPVAAEAGAEVVAEVVEDRQAQSEAAQAAPAGAPAPDTSPPQTSAEPAAQAAQAAQAQAAVAETSSPVADVLAEREAAVTPEPATAQATTGEARESVGW